MIRAGLRPFGQWDFAGDAGGRQRRRSALVTPIWMADRVFNRAT